MCVFFLSLSLLIISESKNLISPMFCLKMLQILCSFLWLCPARSFRSLLGLEGPRWLFTLQGLSSIISPLAWASSHLCLHHLCHHLIAQSKSQGQVKTGNTMKCGALRARSVIAWYKGGNLGVFLSVSAYHLHLIMHLQILLP